MATLKVRQFAEATGYHAQSVYRMVREGQVKATKDANGIWRIPKSEVRRIRAEPRETVAELKRETRRARAEAERLATALRSAADVVDEAVATIMED